MAEPTSLGAERDRGLDIRGRRFLGLSAEHGNDRIVDSASARARIVARTISQRSNTRLFMFEPLIQPLLLELLACRDSSVHRVKIVTH
jgi:hypothetical protein